MDSFRPKLSKDPKELEKAEAESHKRLDSILRKLYLEALKENENKTE